MKCPFCDEENTKVIDSRLMSRGLQVRRRRVCLHCEERFNTYESPELIMPRIIKRDGRRKPFDEYKLRLGIHKALEKRPVGVEAIESMMQQIMLKLSTVGEREVPSSYVGTLVMEALSELDQVAYVRFASVYRRFTDIQSFQEEIQRLQFKCKDHHE